MKNLFALFLISFCFCASIKSQSLLWEISGNGLEESSYLFGTVHLSDQRVFNFNDSVFAKIDECKAFAMEIEVTPENMQGIQNSIFLEDGKSIDQMLSKEDYASLKIFFKDKLDLDLDGLKIFTPMSIISMATMKLAKNDMETYVDNFLYEYAKSKNKKTFSVEPLQLQIDLMKNVPAEYLLDVANDWDNYQGITDNMIAAYAKEDMKALIKIMFSDNGFKKMEDDFIWNRNITMADSIDLFVNRQSTFIAIGTGHLPLEGGVIDLLQKKGYDVKPIVAPKTKALPKINKNKNWVKVAPEEAGFSMEMPMQPELQEFDQATDIGNLELKLYMVEMPDDHENMAYGIAITDYPIEMINSDSMTQLELFDYYEQSLLGGANGVNGVPFERGEIQWDSNLAKTMDVDAYNGAVKIRFAVLLIKNRLFLAQVISRGSLENNQDLEKFLNSFKLINYDLEASNLENAFTKNWETLTSTEGNFSISMFGKPIKKRENQAGELPKNSDPMTYTSESIISKEEILIQTVTYIKLEDGIHSDSIPLTELTEFYDDNLNTTAAKFNVQSIEKNIIDFDGHKAQKSKITIVNQGIILSINALRILYKDRFYYIQVVTNQAEPKEEDLNKFFFSFKILNK